MVSRVQLHNMHQDRDETIRSFCVRARGHSLPQLRKRSKLHRQRLM